MIAQSHKYRPLNNCFLYVKNSVRVVSFFFFFFLLVVVVCCVVKLLLLIFFFSSSSSLLFLLFCFLLLDDDDENMITMIRFKNINNFLLEWVLVCFFTQNNNMLSVTLYTFIYIIITTNVG